MSAAIALRQALGRAARMLGARAESTAAAAAPAASQQLAALGNVPSSDPTLQPYYENLTRMRVMSDASAMKASDSERAVSAAGTGRH